MVLHEWERKKFENPEKIPPFIDYLSSVWNNRIIYNDTTEDKDDDLDFQIENNRQGFFTFTFDGRISARNYVGVVQFEDTRIVVYPKIFKGFTENEKEAFQTNLFTWLSYCDKITFPFSFADLSKIEFNDFLEIFIGIFANYAEEILFKQPYETYQSFSEETLNLKGNIAFPEYVQHNLITGNWQKFYCNYESFSFDNLFNRIVKYVSKRLFNITQNNSHKAKLESIVFILNEVSDSTCIAEDCNKVKLNPLFVQHKDILELCRMFLSNQVIDLQDEDSKNFCFLVPMEYVFEGFIYGFLNRHFPELNAKYHSSNTYLTDQNVFQLQQDIVCENPLIIIDTKYKIREKEDSKDGISQNDMYQMLAYGIRKNIDHIILLYPTTEVPKVTNPSKYTISSELFNQNKLINISAYDICIFNEDYRSILEMVSSQLKKIILK